jgi:hypothetical protein
MQTFCENMIERIKNLRFSDTFEDVEEESYFIDDNSIVDDNSSIDEFPIDIFSDEEKDAGNFTE